MQDELLSWQEARLDTRERGPYMQKVTIALRPPDEGVFSADEMALINRVLADLGPLDAKGASDRSHQESAGWNLTEGGQAIPYESALVSTEKPSTEVFKHFGRLHGIAS